jgi:membrane protease YdiL (CAAX protease family)
MAEAGDRDGTTEQGEVADLLPAAKPGLVARLSAGGGAAGMPVHPLIEAALIFLAFWLGALLPANPAAVGAALAKPLYHVAMVAEILPKALLLLYIMHRSEGLRAFPGMAKPRWADLPASFLTALGALLIVSVCSRVVTALLPALKNPLLSATQALAAPSPLLIPAVLMTALAVGYSEELYFRVYLMKRLGQAGLSLPWAAVGTALLFASGHGLQGWLGLIMGLALGAWFAWRRVSGANLHELAWGHALYDAIVMLASLYYRAPA